MGNDKPEDVGTLPISMVSWKRTWRERTGNTTSTSEYAWHFTCDLQQGRIGEYLFVSQPDFFKNWSIEMKGHMEVNIDILFKPIYIDNDSNLHNILYWI